MAMPPRSNKAKIPRTPDKSQSLHASLSERVKEISTDILSSTALHVDAPEFRPKLRTESKAKSVPASELRTPGRKSRGSSSSSKLDKNVPRFFPAIIKDDLQNKVRAFYDLLAKNVFLENVIYVLLCHYSVKKVINMNLKVLR